MTCLESKYHRFLRIAFAAIVVFTMMGSLSACNTVQGAGEDIESAGDSISDAARDAKD